MGAYQTTQKPLMSAPKEEVKGANPAPKGVSKRISHHHHRLTASTNIPGQFISSANNTGVSSRTFGKDLSNL